MYSIVAMASNLLAMASILNSDGLQNVAQASKSPSDWISPTFTTRRKGRSRRLAAVEPKLSASVEEEQMFNYGAYDVYHVSNEHRIDKNQFSSFCVAHALG